MARPTGATSSSREGKTSRPRMRNIPTWLSHASASCTRSRPVAIGQRPVAEQQAGEVHGEEAAAVGQRRQAEGHQAERQRHHRVEPAGREREPGEQVPAAVSHAGSHRRAHHQLHHHLDRNPPAGCRARRQQVLGEHGGEDDRHRVVDAGLDLERDADPPLELEPASPEHREHRRRIGGGDHRAEQQRLAAIPGRGSARPTATSVAVPATPTVARTPAGAAARRTALSGVLSPPSNRISASASTPIRKANW